MAVGGAGNPDSAETQLDNLYLNQLTDVRGAAGQWIQTLGALVAVSTVVGLIKSRADFDLYSPSTQYAFAAVFLLTLVAAAAAVYFAALAQQGTFVQEALTTTELRDTIQKRTKTAAGQLETSRRLGIVALVLFVATVYVSWFGAEAGTSGTAVLAVLKSGNVACGTLAKGNPAGVAISTDGGTPRPLSNVASLTTVTQCP